VAYPDGFTYVSGPYELRRFNVASTATFKARNPVMLGGARTVIEPSVTTNPGVIGICLNDAASSIYGTEILVLVPNEQTVFATKVPTGVAASALSAGQAYNIAKSGDYFRVDTTSQASAKVVIVPRGDGSTINSVDSSVFVQFAMNWIYPFDSNASQTL
jgi:hypothetical protein